MDISSETNPDLQESNATWDDSDAIMNITDLYPYFNHTVNESVVNRDRKDYLHDQSTATTLGFITAVLCLFGLVTNLINIVVMTRKNMKTPINSILAGLAVADTMVLLSFLTEIIHVHFRVGLKYPDKKSFAWALATIVSVDLQILSHSVSVWLTVALAVWRYMSVCYPTQTMHWRSLRRARIVIMSTGVACFIICIPQYLSFTLRPASTLKGSSKDWKDLYFITYSDFNKQLNYIISDMHFYIFFIVLKIVPCISLTGLTINLVREIYKSGNRSRRLKLISKHDTRRNRTSIMLIAVLVFFLIMHLPEVMVFAIVMLLKKFPGLHNPFINWLPFLDHLYVISMLANSAFNFFIYYLMNTQFRDAFWDLFLKRKGNECTHTNQTQVPTSA